MLALAARELGRDDEADEFEALAASSREKIASELWDETRGLFANRQRAGGFVRSVSPTSLYPLICGAATPDQARRLLATLEDPAVFCGTYGLPNVARADPAYGDNVYWRGRIWPNVNWFVWQGLRRYGFLAEASALAEKSLALFMQSWTSDRYCGENYSAETGAILDQPDTDRFCTWGAMLAMLGVAEILDVNPWGGLEIVNTGDPVTLGPIATPAGRMTLTVADGRLALHRGRTRLLDTDFVGRLTHVEFEAGCIALRLQAADPGRTVFFAFPTVARATVVSARLDGAPIPVRAEGSCGIVVNLAPARSRPTSCSISTVRADP